jgi:16S rRNA (guanine966-N2)-methyltransferase
LTLRVIAGEAKGRKLRTLKGGQTRPTSDRVREALFSSLGDKVIDANVLDLYAGSGALGIESLSRGAASATFVESSREAALVIRKNLEETRVGDAELLNITVEQFLNKPSARRFDLVLVDPPYVLGLPIDTLAVLLSGHLSDDAMVVVEVSSRVDVEAPPGYEVVSKKRYGDTTLVFMKQAEPL